MTSFSVLSSPHENQKVQAETRAEFAERSVQKLQKEVDRLEGGFLRSFVLSSKESRRCLLMSTSCFFCVDELLLEKERVRNLTEEIEQTVQEIQGS